VKSVVTHSSLTIDYAQGDAVLTSLPNIFRLIHPFSEHLST